MLQDDIAAILLAAGTGTPGTDLQFGVLSDTPVSDIALMVYGGSDGTYVEGGDLTTPVVEYPRFSVSVRNPDQQAAWVKARAIRTALRGYSGTVNGTTYLTIKQIGDLGEIPEDGTLGYRVVGSYEAWKPPS